MMAPGKPNTITALLKNVKDCHMTNLSLVASHLSLITEVMVARGGIDNFVGNKIGHAQHARRVRYRDVAQQPPTHKTIVGGSSAL